MSHPPGVCIRVTVWKRRTKRFVMRSGFTSEPLATRRLAGRAFTRIVVLAAVAIAAGSGWSHAQAGAATRAPGTPQEQFVPVGSRATENDGLSDLDAMTFSCSKAGLNAAAREAAKVPSQGTYQFAYFRIVNDAHHAAYEVHFKSNYEGEPDLKYCVSIYCQQGWDPKTTKASVTLMGKERQRMGAAHAVACDPAPAKGPSKR
jgi:hypothetical protein